MNSRPNAFQRWFAAHWYRVPLFVLGAMVLVFSLANTASDVAFLAQGAFQDWRNAQVQKAIEELKFTHESYVCLPMPDEPRGQACMTIVTHATTGSTGGTIEWPVDGPIGVVRQDK
jgi:hypothetical protein